MGVVENSELTNINDALASGFDKYLKIFPGFGDTTSSLRSFFTYNCFSATKCTSNLGRLFRSASLSAEYSLFLPEIPAWDRHLSSVSNSFQILLKSGSLEVPSLDFRWERDNHSFTLYGIEGIGTWDNPQPQKTFSLQLFTSFL